MWFFWNFTHHGMFSVTMQSSWTFVCLLGETTNTYDMALHLHSLAKLIFKKHLKSCIVYFQACYIIVFFTAFVRALLRFFACYFHQLPVSGIVWNWRQQCALHQPCACAQYRWNRGPFIKTLLHSRTSGENIVHIELILVEAIEAVIIMLISVITGLYKVLS